MRVYDVHIKSLLSFGTGWPQVRFQTFVFVLRIDLLLGMLHCFADWDLL